MLPVLFQRGSSDNLDLASGHGRFQNIGRIHSALRATGSDNGMQFINKQQYLTVPAHFVNDIFNSFLKFAPVLGTCHHGSQIQNAEPFVPDGLRHSSLGDSRCKSFHNSGLSHTRLTDQAGIVLGTAA